MTKSGLRNKHTILYNLRLRQIGQVHHIGMQWQPWPKNCDLLLKGLQLHSFQGDVSQADWFEKYFGVCSKQEINDVRLIKKRAPGIDLLNLDFKDNPDIAQTFAVLCVCKGLPFHFKGLHTLKIKETDRISALQAELAKLGARLTEPANGELVWDGLIDLSLKQTPPLINTYHDHRMALAFAPAALTLTETNNQ